MEECKPENLILLLFHFCYINFSERSTPGESRPILSGRYMEQQVYMINTILRRTSELVK